MWHCVCFVFDGTIFWHWQGRPKSIQFNFKSCLDSLQPGHVKENKSAIIYLDWNDQHLLLLMTTKQIYIYLRDLWWWPGDCLALQESFPDFGVLDMHLEVILGYFSITVHHALQSWHLRFLYLLISLNISIRWIEIYCNGTVTSWMVDSST